MKGEHGPGDRRQEMVIGSLRVTFKIEMTFSVAPLCPVAGNHTEAVSV